jgi:hypothetical protein
LAAKRKERRVISGLRRVGDQFRSPKFYLKKKNKAKRKGKAWLVILIHGFISFASSSLLDLPALPRSFPV